MPRADAAVRLLRSDRLPQVVALTLSLELLVAAGVLAGPLGATPPQPAAVAPAAPVAAAAPEVQGAVRLSAPELWVGQVDAQPLDVDARGSLEVPASEAELGWWADGPRPGSPGAAVVVGHVDLAGRPGVFVRLSLAQPGMTIDVARGDGTSVRFRVTRVSRYAKSAFPTDVVYRPTAQAELRLVTCGGRFNPRTGHYEDNVVVEAVREQPA